MFYSSLSSQMYHLGSYEVSFLFTENKQINKVIYTHIYADALDLHLFFNVVVINDIETVQYNR